jgi:hypothetical protein
LTQKGKRNHYNVKLLRGYGVSINLKDNRIILKNGQNEIKHHTDTATIFNTLNVRGIKKIRIIVPPLEYLKRFEIIGRPLRKEIENNAVMISNLIKIRDSLLPKLM